MKNIILIPFFLFPLLLSGQVIVGPDSICLGTPYHYTLTNPPAGYISWEVSFIGSIVSGQGTSDIVVIWNISVGIWPWVNCDAAIAPLNYTYSPVPLPDPSIGGLNYSCQNGIREYGTGNFASYLWSVEGGNILSGQGTQNIQVQWTVPGTGHVHLSCTNSIGCASASPASFEVMIPAISILSIAGNDSVCGGSQRYTVTVQNPVMGLYQYNWKSPVNGTIIKTNGPDCDILWNPISAPTAGSVDVTVENSFGCPDSTGFPVVIFPDVNPSLTGGTSSCVGTTVVYRTDPGQSEYWWTVTGASILGRQDLDSAVVKWNTPGIQSLTVTYKTPGGCRTGRVFSETIIGQPGSSISGSNDTVYMAETRYSTNPGMSGYQWTVTDGEILSGATTNSVRVRWSSMGANTILVQYTTSNGCLSKTTAKTVEISPSICMITYDSLSGRNMVVINQVNDPHCTFFRIYKKRVAGLDSIIGTIPVSQTEFTDISTDPSKLSAAYRVSALVLGAESHLAPPHNTMWLNNSFYNGQVQLAWRAYEGFTFPQYAVLRKKGHGDWEQLATVSPQITEFMDTNPPGGTVSYCLGISPACSGPFPLNMIISNVTTINGLGVSEREPDPVSFFPNPVSGSLTVRISRRDFRDGMVRVVDLLGMVHREAHCSGNEISLDLASLPSGLYFIQFRSLTESCTKPLVKH